MGFPKNFDLLMRALKTAVIHTQRARLKGLSGSNSWRNAWCQGRSWRIDYNKIARPIALIIKSDGSRVRSIKSKSELPYFD